MKKLILAITASLCIATLISSCNNLGISAPKMDSDEATQLIVETLEKNINFDEWKIYEIRWMEADELENNLTVFAHINLHLLSLSSPKIINVILCPKD